MCGTPHLLQAIRTQSCTKKNLLPLSSDTGQCNVCVCVCGAPHLPGTAPIFYLVPKVKGPITKEPSLNVNVKILGKMWCTTVFV